MTNLLPPAILPIVLLVLSNVFMTFAWYGHLKYKTAPLVVVILVSWGIAFIEYCLAVPANRWGSDVYSAAQLKTIQEVVTLIVFAGFSVTYLKEPLQWNHALGFALIAAGAYFIFHKWCDVLYLSPWGEAADRRWGGPRNAGGAFRVSIGELHFAGRTRSRRPCALSVSSHIAPSALMRTSRMRSLRFCSRRSFAGDGVAVQRQPHQHLRRRSAPTNRLAAPFRETAFRL